MSMGLDDWFRLASALGFDGTEIHERSLASFDKDYLQDIVEAVKSNNLQVSQLICATDFTNPDPILRDREVQTLKQYIDASSLLDGCCLRITAGQVYPDIPRELTISWVVDCFRRCLEYALNKEVLLAYENHYQDYFWERPDFSMKHEIYLEILDQLEDTHLKVNFDCANPIMIGEDPSILLLRVLDRIVHVHCSDRATLYDYTHSVPGEGLVDFKSIFNTLKKAGWDGWLSIEYNGVEGVDGLRRASTFIRKAWEEA